MLLITPHLYGNPDLYEVQEDETRNRLWEDGREVSEAGLWGVSEENQARILPDGASEAQRL